MLISNVLNIKILNHREYVIVIGKLVCICGITNRNYCIGK